MRKVAVLTVVSFVRAVLRRAVLRLEVPGVLVVVDSQPRYVPEGAVLNRMAQEIQEARRKGWQIVFLEYHTAGPTHTLLTDLVRGYVDRSEVVPKTTYGGGKQVVEICRARGWDLSNVRVIGALTYCCVALTVQELNDELPESVIEVVTGACYDTSDSGSFRSHEKIRWI